MKTEENRTCVDLIKKKNKRKLREREANSSQRKIEATIYKSLPSLFSLSLFFVSLLSLSARVFRVGTMLKKQQTEDEEEEEEVTEVLRDSLSSLALSSSSSSSIQFKGVGVGVGVGVACLSEEAMAANISAQNNNRWRDLDKLLTRPGNLVGQNFEPGPELRDDIQEYVRVLVVGAGGLGCELLKDLALSGFKNIDVIDMDRIEVTNLNRQFLFRLQDVGKPKAEVAAMRVMERVSGVNIVPHFSRIEDKDLDFYSNFSIIALGLDSIEARSYINSVACSFLEYDSEDNPCEDTMKPMVDGGTEGFKGHARVILPGITPCFECTIWLFPPQVKFPLCTLAETPRTAAHCIEYAHLIKWDEVHSGKAFDADDPEHMQWVYSEAVKRAEFFGIPGVTYSLTQGVVKNIIPAIASTNAIISAACALEALKIATGCSKTLSNYLTYNGLEGLHTKVTEFVRDNDCLVCGPGVLLELDTSITLQKFIDLLAEHPKLLLTKASVTYRGKNLYMQAPPVLEEMTRSNLNLPLFELMDKTPKDIINVNGTTINNDKKTTCLRKLRVVFKGIGGVTDMDMAGGA